MNNDLISRSALKRAIEDRMDYVPSNDYDQGWNAAINTALDEIVNAPTVEEKSYAMGYQDGAEDGLQGIRPKSKWIWRETGTSNFRYGYFTCSNCSFVSKAKQNFCAECGAEMI